MKMMNFHGFGDDEPDDCYQVTVEQKLVIKMLQQNKVQNLNSSLIMISIPR